MRLITKLVSRFHVLLYRLTRGHMGARLGRSPVLLLTTTGRKSGKGVTTPLLYLQDGDSLVVIASFGGSPKHPAWYLNLQKDPRCLVQVKGRKTPMTAETVRAEARQSLWDRAVAMYRPYEDYQKKTDRLIPVVRLDKAS